MALNTSYRKGVYTIPHTYIFMGELQHYNIHIYGTPFLQYIYVYINRGTTTYKTSNTILRGVKPELDLYKLCVTCTYLV